MRKTGLKRELVFSSGGIDTHKGGVDLPIGYLLEI